MKFSFTKNPERKGFFYKEYKSKEKESGGWDGRG